jgi:hypothetical protein
MHRPVESQHRFYVHIFFMSLIKKAIRKKVGVSKRGRVGDDRLRTGIPVRIVAT